MYSGQLPKKRGRHKKKKYGTPSLSKAIRKQMVPKNDLSDYSFRNAALKELGFANYWDYLRSMLWTRIKSRVLFTKGRMCSVCKRARYRQFHHCDYSADTLTGVTISEIYPICRECHELVETQNGHKVSFATACDRFRFARDHGIPALIAQDAR